MLRDKGVVARLVFKILAGGDGRSVIAGATYTAPAHTFEKERTWHIIR
ncbi:MAG: hypothetical protein HKO10_11570 [Acidimicrobiia bacterium]|nr:hypothetical protein [Acidimicrobiia bacterium]